MDATVLKERELAGALDTVRTLVASAAVAAPAPEHAMVRMRIATLLRIDPVGPTTGDARVAALPDWPTSKLFSSADRELLGLAEQFVLDVAEIDDRQRERFRSRLGAYAPIWSS